MSLLTLKNKPGKQCIAINWPFITVMLLLVFQSVFAHASGWEVTRFKIYFASPIDSPDWRRLENSGRETSNFRSSPLNLELIQKMEAFLQETAQLYSSLGFADPVTHQRIDSVIDLGNGEKAIRLYLYPTEGGPGGWYSSGRPDAEPRTNRRVMNINSLLYKNSEYIADSNYQTLAHELVHAIQAASKSCQQDPCPRQKWYTEGTADALGYYATARILNLQFKEEMKDNQFIKVFGVRPYSTQLNQPADSVDEAYATSSFWTYLGELAYAAEHGKIRTHNTPATEVSFKYLVDFYGSSYPYGSGAGAEITWINQVIQKHPHLSGDLPTLFAQFVAVFANHIHTRIGPLGLVPIAAEREPRWLKRLFLDCPVIGPVGDFLPGSHSQHMFKNAARCTQVNLKPGSAGKTLRIQARNSNKAQLEQLRIGIMDGSYVSLPTIADKKNAESDHIASWDFPLANDDSMTLIISNMATQPVMTKRFTQKFLFLVDNFKHNMGANSTGPQQHQSTSASASTKSNSSPVPIKPSHRQRVKQHMQLAISDPTAHLAPVTKVERKKYQDTTPCGADSLFLKRCSSQLKLTLTLSPLTQNLSFLDAQTFALPALTEGQIGVDPMGNPIDANYLQSLQKIEQYLESNDGSKITIELPRIEYGFTGTINDAMIRVSHANQPHHPYESYGPTVQAGLRRIHQPPNGHVTIEEYQPTVIRGSFQADLIDPKNSGDDDSPIVAKNISGEFLIPAPWRGDGDYEIDQEHLKYALRQKILQQSPFGTLGFDSVIAEMGGPPLALCESGYTDEEIISMGFLKSCEQVNDIIIDQLCSCTCDQQVAEAQNKYCPTACQQQWLACDSPVNETVKSTIPDGLEAQVKLYQQYLSKNNVPENLQQTLIAAFRKAPLFQRKMMLKEYLNN